MRGSARQHGATALMLFGDRITAEQLEVEIESEFVMASEAVMDLIEHEADQPGVILLEPHGGDEPEKCK